MASPNQNQTKNLSILDRVQRIDGVCSEKFEPKFSSKLQNSSEKMSVAIQKTTTTYRSEEKKFGGKPFPWD